MMALLIAVVLGIVFEMAWQGGELLLEIALHVVHFVAFVLGIIGECLKIAVQWIRWEWKLWRLKKQISRI